MSRPLDRVALRRVQAAFERIGLLMQADASLPSVTTLVCEGPVRGSWWSHPRAHEIYDVIQAFDHEGKGALRTKLVNGKVTYVHPRLWPALVRAAGTRSLADAVSPVARELRARVSRQGSVRTDELRDAGFAPSRAIGQAVRELEARLLVHTDEVHTESGAHAKRVQTWGRWARDAGVGPGRLTLPGARLALEQAAGRLGAEGEGHIALPWQARERNRSRVR